MTRKNFKWTLIQLPRVEQIRTTKSGSTWFEFLITFRLLPSTRETLTFSTTNTRVCTCRFENDVPESSSIVRQADTSQALVPFVKKYSKFLQIISLELLIVSQQQWRKAIFVLWLSTTWSWRFLSEIFSERKHFLYRRVFNWLLFSTRYYTLH